MEETLNFGGCKSNLKYIGLFFFGIGALVFEREVQKSSRAGGEAQCQQTAPITVDWEGKINRDRHTVPFVVT